MALTELVSNLSVGLYGAPTPSQFVMPIGPGSSNTPTDAVTFATTNNGSLFYIQNSGNGISRRIVLGFNNLGYLAFFGNKQSKDFFPLFTALGENGTSRRMNQGGYGFPFPSSPITSDSFEWKPEAHTGWNINNRYNDTIKNSLKIGLADTYTTNSPDLFSTFKFPIGIFGTATLRNQGGIGFPFPKGPTGNVYDWKPNAHTGWSDANKYNDNIGAIYGNSGLADTYTTNSPIDDIYNKVKVRSAAWNKNSFGLATDQPFILRGIQRDNNSEPQFWGGFADTLTDIPRGGITTATEREAVDKARLGKFMISPKGLIFQAKQFGLQLMNPNVEGVTGFWTGVTPRSNKIYNPLSVFSLNSPVPLHVRRDSFDPSGLTSYSYESVINDRNVLGFGTSFNRLKTLYDEAFNGFGLGPLFNTPTGLPYLTISNLTGPKSVLGIGITNNNRYTNTSLRQSSLVRGAPGLNFVTNPLTQNPADNLYFGSTYDFARYKYDNVYTKRDSPLTDENEAEWSREGRAKIRHILKDPFANLPFPDSSKVLGKNSDVNVSNGNRYATLAYGQMERDTKQSYMDFREAIAGPSTKNFTINPDNLETGSFDYKKNNLVSRIGIGDYGKLTLDRSNPIKNSATTDSDADQLILGKTSKDLVTFKFTINVDIDSAGPRNGTGLQFRAYIGSISDSHASSTEEITIYYNQTSPMHRHGGPKSRNITVDFTIPILSYRERDAVLAKLNTLAKATSPVIYNNDIKLPVYPAICKIQIGNFINTTCMIDQVSYDIDNEIPWDIDHETPMMINASVSCKEAYRNYYNTDDIKIIA